MKRIKSKKTFVGVFLILAVLFLGVGYAAIVNITLKISGTLGATADDKNFEVAFSDKAIVTSDSKITAEKTDDLNVTIKVTGLTAKGDHVTATYEIENKSEGTMAIDLEYNLVDKNNQKFLECEKGSFNYIYLIIDIILLIIDSILIYKLNNCINQTRSAISTYKKELKKILNNYKEFIQKVNNEIDLSKYQVVKIDSFTDMLEIREIIQSPILMLENKKENGVYFLISTQTKLIYAYDLKVSDMKKKENENVDFNE